MTKAVGRSDRVRARKRFGQHFLEPAWARRLVEVIRPSALDTFVEIGPGSGALTLPLAESGATIVAIEIDRDLAARLAAKAPPNVTVVTGDFLDTDFFPIVAGLTPQASALTVSHGAATVSPRLRVVGNLPYNIASPIVFRLLALHQQRGAPAEAILMLQREVAARLLARPGSRDYGVLSILAQLHADVSRLLTLPAGAFRPVPRVRSALVRLVFRPAAVPLSDPDLFEAMVRRLFTRRRKTVLNALRPFAAALGASPEAALAVAGVNARRRPETLQLTELSDLVAFFAAARRRAVV